MVGWLAGPALVVAHPHAFDVDIFSCLKFLLSACSADCGRLVSWANGR